MERRMLAHRGPVLDWLTDTTSVLAALCWLPGSWSVEDRDQEPGCGPALFRHQATTTFVTGSSTGTWLHFNASTVQYNCSGLCIVCIDIIQSYRNWRWFYLKIKNILVMVIHLYGGCSNVIVNICFDAILANGFSFTDSEQDLCCCLCGLWFVFCPLPQSLYAIRIEITMPLSYFILVQLCCCLVGE